jgi:hypothetical protein
VEWAVNCAVFRWTVLYVRFAFLRVVKVHLSTFRVRTQRSTFPQRAIVRVETVLIFSIAVAEAGNGR